MWFTKGFDFVKGGTILRIHKMLFLSQSFSVHRYLRFKMEENTVVKKNCIK